MRSTAVWIAMTGTVLLAACAATSLSTAVSSFGDWPADRQAGSYAFERLPSQQALGAESDALEAAAQGALLKAGFTAAAPGEQPDVLVQVGARSSLAGYQTWDDPLWWRGGFGYWRHGPWMSPHWAVSARYDFPRYEREVAVLIRDRASGKPLFEARSSSEGNARADSETLAAMFEAALMDFPRRGVNPRRVVVPLPD